MATESPTPMNSATFMAFAYRAQTREGQTITGIIDAPTAEEARLRLQALQLATVEIETSSRPSRPRALHGDDFAAFNQQLAQLTSSGLPVEQGLRLIAAEMGRGSIKRTLEQVAAELERGQSLPQAIERHRAQFPPLYANLVDAGIRAGSLPRVLLNLGRHLTLVRRMQAMLWRTFSYPLLVMVAFSGILCFILIHVLPQFQSTFHDFHVELPGVTAAMMALSNLMATQAALVAMTGVGIIGVIAILIWMTARERSVAERFLLWLPLVGPVLRRNLISRWCDVVGIGVEAGMDLPAAIGMADDAIGSAALRQDGQAIVAAVSRGGSIAQAVPGRVLPPMVTAAIDLSSSRNDLPQGLLTLSQLYEQQAEMRLATVETILTPLVILFIGLAIGLLCTALFAPMISLIETVSGPQSFHHH
jgi:type IV pilus assembly protein PilC